MILNVTTEEHHQYKLHVDPSRITELFELTNPHPTQQDKPYRVKLDHRKDYFYIDEETAERIKQYLNRPF